MTHTHTYGGRVRACWDRLVHCDARRLGSGFGCAPGGRGMYATRFHHRFPMTMSAETGCNDQRQGSRLASGLPNHPEKDTHILSFTLSHWRDLPERWRRVANRKKSLNGGWVCHWRRSSIRVAFLHDLHPTRLS